MIIKYKGKYDVRSYDLIFKGGYYKVDFTVYSDCLNIDNMVYICDGIEVEKEQPKFLNRVLKPYEVEYKQIYTLLKNEVLQKTEV